MPVAGAVSLREAVFRRAPRAPLEPPSGSPAALRRGDRLDVAARLRRAAEHDPFTGRAQCRNEDPR